MRLSAGIYLVLVNMSCVHLQKNVFINEIVIKSLFRQLLSPTIFSLAVIRVSSSTSIILHFSYFFSSNI